MTILLCVRKDIQELPLASIVVLTRNTSFASYVFFSQHNLLITPCKFIRKEKLLFILMSFRLLLFIILEIPQISGS